MASWGMKPCVALPGMQPGHSAAIQWLTCVSYDPIALHGQEVAPQHEEEEEEMPPLLPPPLSPVSATISQPQPSLPLLQNGDRNAYLPYTVAVRTMATG